MSTEQTIDTISIREHVEAAAERIGRVWPLYSDVAANPLRGYEQQNFWEAVRDANELLHGDGYPDATRFREAWEDGRIDTQILESIFRQHGVEDSPEEVLSRMESNPESESDPDPRSDSGTTQLDRLMAKWLAGFLDQGQAAWPMPDRTEGFYQSWRKIASHDTRIPGNDRLADFPETASEALAIILGNHSEESWERILEHHLAALPGWTGFIKQRMEQDHGRQVAAPITLTQYLAVRLLTSRHLRQVQLDTADHVHIPDAAATDSSPCEVTPPTAELWLSAWEETYRSRVLPELATAAQESQPESAHPDAQLVFCIDTRSEILRRHIEQVGQYQTRGYAGFFGVPMRHETYEGTQHDSCPAIIDPNYLIKRRQNGSEQGIEYDQWRNFTQSTQKAMKSLKNDVIGAFGFVELAGSGFAPLLGTRTLAPSFLRTVYDQITARFGDPSRFAEPDVSANEYTSAAEEYLYAPNTGTPGDQAGVIQTGMSFEEKLTCAKAAFDLMGWDSFAPIVVFAGHTSQTDNNPYESSIDCGACSGSSGLPNARVLAKICNDPDIRDELRSEGIEIPEETVFIAGEHNTTTDNVDLLIPDDVQSRHERDISQLRADLESAQERATAERMDTLGLDVTDPVGEAERRSVDWAEPRPEIGLSGNAAFVIAPREITAEVDFDGRAFLHSYDYRTDEDGDALENIMAGPAIVTKMINLQYYFSTVDSSVYGSGSKVTHNPVGHLGVLQGNGGDLMIGLPKQSLQSDEGRLYHEPLRQSIIIQAPVEQVTRIIDHSSQLSQLFDNDWMHLSVIDPEQQNRVFQYEQQLNWTPMDETGLSSPASVTDEVSTLTRGELSMDGGDEIN